MIDIVEALNALEEAQKGQEARTNSPYYYNPCSGRRCIVGEALHRLGVSDRDLYAMGGTKIERLYERGELTVDLSLGALVVFRSAQRTQDGLHGEITTWGKAFEAAIATAGRFMSLMPDSLVANAAPSTPALETV